MINGKIFENECYKWLCKKFEDVKQNRNFNRYDFTCYNNGVLFNVDAKSINKNNQIQITFAQRDCAFFIVKINGNLIMASLNTLKNKFGLKTIMVKSK